MGAFLIPDNFVLRTDLKLEELAVYRIPLENWRVWDAVGTQLPSAAANDDLGLISGTLGTSQTSIQTGDLKATTTTRYGRFGIVLPVEYQAGETVQVRFQADMETNVADTSCTIDLVAYINGTGSDICATAATSMNSLTSAYKTFDLTATNLSAGVFVDCRVAITVTDAATGTAVIGRITRADLLCDIRG